MLNKADVLQLLEETDKELPAGTEIRITVAGASALMFLRDNRQGTMDVDVIEPAQLPAELKVAAEKVATRHGIRKDWLNTSAQFIPQPQLDIVPEQVFTGDNGLIVFIPDPTYMLAMKLLAARPQDLGDALALARRTGNKTYGSLMRLMRKAYSAELHTEFNEAFISEVANKISPHYR